MTNKPKIMKKNHFLMGITFLGLMITITLLRVDVRSSVMNFNFAAVQEYLSQTAKRNFRMSRNLALTVDRTIPDRVCASAGIKSGEPIVTDQEREAGTANLQANKSSDNMIAQYFETNDAAELMVPIITLVAPWAVMLIISIFGYSCYCCCSFCDCCCPPSQCCRHKAPYNKCEVVWPAIGTTATAIMFFAVGIVGLAQQKDVQTGVSKVMCSLVRMIDDVRHGAVADGGEIFTGAVNLTNKMEAFGLMLPEFQSNIQTKLSQTPENLNWRATASLTANGAINTLDGMAGKTYTGSSMGLSVLFATGTWSPQSTSTTIVGIANQFWTEMKNGLQTAIDTIYDLASPFGVQMTDIKAVIDGAVTTLGDLAKTLNDLLTTADDNNTTLTDYTPMLTQAVSGIAAFGLVVSISAGVILVVIYFLQQRGIRQVLHLCWVIMGPIMIISLLVTMVMHPMAVILTDTCDVISQTIHNEEKWDSYGIFPDMIQTCKKFTTCKAGAAKCDGDGNLLKALEVDKQLSSISGFIVDLKDTKQQFLDAPSTQQYVDDALIEYDKLKATVTHTKTYSTFMASGTTTEVPEAAALLTTTAAINTFLVRAPGGCTVLTEKLYYGTTCSETTWASDISTIKQNVGTNQCVQIDTYSKLATTVEKAQDRYGGSGKCVDCTTITGNPANCDNTFQTNMKNVMTFVSEKNGFCETAITNFDIVQTQINVYSAQLELTQTAVNDFIDDTIELITIATQTDQTNQYCIGDKCLLTDLNCLFIDSSIERIYDGVCIGFVSSLLNLAQIMIAFSVALFSGSFFMFCTALRNARTQDDQEAVKVEPNEQYGEEAVAMNNPPQY